MDGFFHQSPLYAICKKRGFYPPLDRSGQSNVLEGLQNPHHFHYCTERQIRPGSRLSDPSSSKVAYCLASGLISTTVGLANRGRRTKASCQPKSANCSRLCCCIVVKK